MRLRPQLIMELNRIPFGSKSGGILFNSTGNFSAKSHFICNGNVFTISQLIMDRNSVLFKTGNFSANICGFEFISWKKHKLPQTSW